MHGHGYCFFERLNPLSADEFSQPNNIEEGLVPEIPSFGNVYACSDKLLLYMK